MPSPEDDARSREPRVKFCNKLLELGYHIPEYPDSSRTFPNRLLIRGEPINSRFQGRIQSEFQPQSGEWGRYGVFMGDCISAAIYPQSSAVYLIDLDRIKTNRWIVTMGDEYKRLLREIATGERFRSKQGFRWGGC